jgi:hypothetical protein
MHLSCTDMKTSPPFLFLLAFKLILAVLLRKYFDLVQKFRSISTSSKKWTWRSWIFAAGLRSRKPNARYRSADLILPWQCAELTKLCSRMRRVCLTAAKEHDNNFTSARVSSAANWIPAWSSLPCQRWTNTRIAICLSLAGAILAAWSRLLIVWCVMGGSSHGSAGSILGNFVLSP